MPEQNKEQKFLAAYFLIWALAFFLRFGALGAAPLNENEAKLAFQSFRLFDGAEVGAVGQLLYVLPTAILFRFFGASEWTARLLPALCGAVAAVLPYLIRKRIGEKKALFFALMLAIEPTLLYWSKIADSQSILVFLILAALCAFFRGNHTLAICFILLSVSAGVRFWPLFGAVCFAFCLMFALSKAFPEKGFQFPVISTKDLSPTDVFLPVLILTLFATAFFTYPEGLGALGSGLTESFRVAGKALSVGIVPTLIALFLYCGFPLVLVLTDKDVKGMPFLFAVLGFVLLFLLGQGVLLLPWLSLVCWAAECGRCITFLTEWRAIRKSPFRLAFWLIIAVWSFLFLRISEIAKGSNLNGPLMLNIAGKAHSFPISRMVGYLIILLIGLVIFLLIVRIFASYFETDVVGKGYNAGVVLILSWVTLSNIWGACGFSRSADSAFERRTQVQPELLGGQQKYFISEPMMTILSDASKKDNGSAFRVHGTNALISEPLLRWNFRKDTYMVHAALSAESIAGSAVLLDADLALHEAEGFIGTVLPWKASVSWERLTSQDWLTWLIYRDVPLNNENLTLWQRTSFMMDHAASENYETQGVNE